MSRPAQTQKVLGGIHLERSRHIPVPRDNLKADTQTQDRLRLCRTCMGDPEPVRCSRFPSRHCGRQAHIGNCHRWKEVNERCPIASSSLRQMPFRRSSTAFSRSRGLAKNKQGHQKLCHCADLQRTSLDKTHPRTVCSLGNGSNLFSIADSDSTLALDPRHVLATVARFMNLLHFKRCRQFPPEAPPRDHIPDPPLAQGRMPPMSLGLGR